MTTLFLLSYPAMWGVSRITARFLLFAMLAPAFGPIAMATSAQPEAMHCMHHSMPSQSALDQTASDPQPQITMSTMSCHHAMAASTTMPSEGASSEPDPNEVSLRAVNSCCQDHNCCCCAVTSEWAEPASRLLSSVIFQIKLAPSLPSLVYRSTLVSGLDSARAPPRT